MIDARDYPTLDLAVAALQSRGGGDLVLPPGVYQGPLTLSGNYRARVLGYGAVLFAPDGGVALDVATGNGGSALGWTVQGMHVKGYAKRDAVGVRISDSDRTRLRDVSFERLDIAVQLRTSGGADGCESTSLADVQVNNCGVGVDFDPAGGTGYFCQTTTRALDLNNCGVGVRVKAGSNLVRADLSATAWVPSGAAAVEVDSDVQRARMRIGAEGYLGQPDASGLRLGSDAKNLDLADLTFEFSGSISYKIVDGAAATGLRVVWREGATLWRQVKGGKPVAVVKP